MDAAEAPKTPGERQSFLSHLEELRSRLVKALLAVLVAFGLAYSQVDKIFSWLTVPLKTALPNTPLVMIRLTEGFMTFLKLGLWTGLFLASPVVLYQIWAFIAPGLYRHERRLIGPLVVASTILFVAGAALAYYFALPFMLRYLMSGYSSEEVKPMLAVSSYVSSACLVMATAGLIFQIPLVMLLLARMGIIKAAQLAKNRKYVLLVSFVIGAVLSPPDVFSQTLVSVPLFLLFEVSIWAIRVQDLLRRGKGTQQTPAAPPAPAG
ncbi:MAG TPA: twin-arginine translocase subunit TatC [bacterium]